MLFDQTTCVFRTKLITVWYDWHIKISRIIFSSFLSYLFICLLVRNGYSLTWYMPFWRTSGLGTYTVLHSAHNSAGLSILTRIHGCQSSGSIGPLFEQECQHDWLYVGSNRIPLQLDQARYPRDWNSFFSDQACHFSLSRLGCISGNSGFSQAQSLKPCIMARGMPDLVHHMSVCGCSPRSFSLALTVMHRLSFRITTKTFTDGLKATV